VKEQQLLQELNRIEGRVSIPDQRFRCSRQQAGRDWREFRNVTLRWTGGDCHPGMLAVLGDLLSPPRRGSARERPVRRTIVRFTAFERSTLMTAPCSSFSAVSGLNITVRPSAAAAADWFPRRSPNGRWAKYAHTI